jgi:hypothetical protein
LGQQLKPTLSRKAAHQARKARAAAARAGGRGSPAGQPAVRARATAVTKGRQTMARPTRNRMMGRRRRN